jgi:hypothetical protein
MVYTTAEYIGMALLVVGFLAAGFAVSRLDHVLTREPEGDGHTAAQADSNAAEESGPVAEATAGQKNPTAKIAAPHAPGTRRERRKHGR